MILTDKEKIKKAEYLIGTLHTLGVFESLKEHDPDIAETLEHIRDILISLTDKEEIEHVWTEKEIEETAKETRQERALEKIKKAATFIDSFLVRTNTNLKKYTASKDLPNNESVIEILESQKRVLEKIKEILT